MSNRPLPESLLALVAGRDRAAAIYGDLLELAPTHSRLWFASAYARTVLAFAWRTPLAIIAAIVSAKYLRKIIVIRLIQPVAIHLNTPRLWALRHSQLAHFSWEVSWFTLLFLWIAFPYVAIRFGLRNRLTYLAGTLYLLALPMYTFLPLIYEFTGLAIALIVVAALASAAWRRQMIFLFANCAVVYLAFYFSIDHPALGIFRHGLRPASLFGMRIDDPVVIAVTAVIGPALYRWLLQPRPTGAAHA